MPENNNGYSDVKFGRMCNELDNLKLGLIKMEKRQDDFEKKMIETGENVLMIRNDIASINTHIGNVTKTMNDTMSGLPCADHTTAIKENAKSQRDLTKKVEGVFSNFWFKVAIALIGLLIMVLGSNIAFHKFTGGG